MPNALLNSTRKNLPTLLILTLSLVFCLVGFLPPLISALLFIYSIGLYSLRSSPLQDKSIAIVSLWLAVIFTGLSIGLYRPSGFNYPLLFSVESLHENGKDFSLYVNIGKGLAGGLSLFILLKYYTEKPRYIHSPSKQASTALVFAFIILSLAYYLLNLDFHLKPLELILLFGLSNLLVSCIAEEAFMRLIVQAQIRRFIEKKISQNWLLELLPLLATTIVFMATHSLASPDLAVVYSIAGFLYGLIYTLTKNVFAAIALHFMVNLFHFAFLTYPL